MKANRVNKTFITANDTAIPISAVRAIWLFSRNTYPHGGINIVSAIKILVAVYPGLSLRDAKDMIDLYLAIQGTDIPESV
jgi:hypothetical protein